jgi:uncharacterized repeat protein (TIGR02543 family)
MSLFLNSIKMRAALLAAAGLCLFFASEARAEATVTFNADDDGAYGTLTAVIKGENGTHDIPITSGASVNSGKRVTFTPIYDNERYRVLSWWLSINGSDIIRVPPSPTFMMEIAANTTSLYVMVSFELIPGYKVTFIPNGGTVYPESVRTDADGILAYLPTPTRPGHAFEGWYTELTGGMEVTTSTPITANTTIYAHWTLTYAKVLFHVEPDWTGEANGTLTAAIAEEDGTHAAIVSGDSVDIGKSVVFTAIPDERYAVARWTLNREEIIDTSLAASYTYRVENSNAINVTVSFETFTEPPDSGGVTEDGALSGGVTVGPNPVRAGDDLTIYWIGNKAVSGNLAVFDAIGNMVTKVNVNGAKKIGTWKVGRIAGGAYLIKGVLRDKDDGKVKVSKLVGVFR